MGIHTCLFRGIGVYVKMLFGDAPGYENFGEMGMFFGARI